MISDINPHNVAVLIAMAQEAQRIQSRSKSQDQIAVLFEVLESLRNYNLLTSQQLTIIAPTPDRDALYVYRASVSLNYLESFIDIHKPLESEIRIFRATIPFNDTAILLETLGQILDMHQRLEAATKSIMAMEKESWTQKRAVDAEENQHPIKQQRYSKLPLANIAAPNRISGG
ncbi:hypothetical protein G7Y89_g9355 [Cudoniella acicularis]|uniref:Uncharacterized protein n=1 Tax=Cudoniella acicularis TaxID=354080 RepID=A0A8H4RFR6_9HELO|nr:hypothetical protein G7Y89_g9355 [Cudoniella acicularis]